MRRRACVDLLALAAAALLACDGQGPRTPAHIVIAPNHPRVPMGGTIQLTATVADADGRAIDGEPVTFQSSDITVLTVSGSGLLTSVGPLGTSVVSAASGGVSAEVEAGVVRPPSSLDVSPTSLDLEPGESVTLSVTVTDEDGDSVPGPGVLFRTSNTAVATVTNFGRVTGGEPGGATISASIGELSREILVAVAAP